MKNNFYVPKWNFLLLLAILNIFCFLNKNWLNSYKNILLLFILPIFIMRIIIKAHGVLSRSYLYVIAILIVSMLFYPIGEKGIGSILNLLLLCIYLIEFSEYSWKKYEIQFIGYCSGIINVYYFFNSQNYTSNYYSMLYSNDTISEINPNIIGLTLLFTCMIFCISVTCFKSLKAKIISTIIMCLITLVTLWRMDCRGSIGALIVFIFFSYCIPIKLKTKRNIKILYWLVIALSIAIPFIYLKLYLRNFTVDLFGMGKNFYSGREIIWAKYLSYIKNNIVYLLTGLGSQNKVLTDMHNNTLALLVNYGLIVTSMIYCFFFSLFKKVLASKTVPKTIICCGGFIAVMIASWTEATIYFSPAYFFFALFLGWGNYFAINTREEVDFENHYCN